MEKLLCLLLLANSSWQMAHSQIADSSLNLKLKAVSDREVEITNYRDCQTEVMIVYNGTKQGSVYINPKQIVVVALPEILPCSMVKIKQVKNCTGKGEASNWLQVLTLCVLPVQYNRVERPLVIRETTTYKVYTMGGQYLRKVRVSSSRQLQEALSNLPKATYILSGDNGAYKYSNQ